MVQPISMDKGRTIKDAIAIALEALPPDVARMERGVETLRSHLMLWMKDYARVRNVILTDADIGDDVTAAIETIRKAVRR